MPKADPARFGVFEVDLESGDLLKDGVRLRIQEQPFKVLRVLLAKPGEVITREELKQSIAPDSAFGDFDHALNVAVAKLRTALNDSADKPLYIETLHKRGYRFIAPVSGAARVVAPEAPKPVVPPAEVTTATTTTQPVEQRRWMVKVAVVCGIAIVAIAVAFLLWPQSQVHTYQPVAFTTMEGTAGAPAFSPDGTEIAFPWSGPTTPRARIYVQAIGSTVARRLVDDPDPNHGEQQPRWWPDGHGVVFIRNTPDGRQELWSVPRSGGAAQKLSDLARNAGYDISPDGTTIAVAERESALAPASIYVVRLQDQSRRRLTTPPPQGASASAPFAIGDSLPRFSPDGRQVAFIHEESTGSDVHIVDVAGGEPLRLTQDNVPISGLAWVADGRSLLLTTQHDNTGAFSLWRFWIRGGRWERIAASTNTDWGVAVSRQGRRVAFVEQVAHTNIWRYAVSGGKLENPEPLDLTKSVSFNVACAYSPDGARFAFASNRTGHFEIYIANSDGSAPVQLTAFNGKDAGSPQWSPDGRKVAFDYRPGAHAQIFMVDAAGGTPKQVVTSDSNDVLPHWSRDGNWIYFARQRPSGSDLWKVPSTGGTPLLVAKDGFSVEESFDRQTLYYNKAFQRGLYSRPLAGGEERALVPDVGGATGGRGSYVPFELTGEGIYFLDHSRNPGSLNYYDFKTGVATKMVDFHLVTHGPSLSVSPDGKFLLVSAGDLPQSNVMLIENFE